MLCPSIAILTFAAAASRPPSEQAQPKAPVFSSATQLVHVDLVVTDGKGRLVTDLTASDFIVKEDGRPQRVVSFQALSTDLPDDTAVATAPVNPAEPGHAPSAKPRVLAVTALFVDDGQMAQDDVMRLRPALKDLLRHLSDRGGGLALMAPHSGVSIGRALPEGADDLASATSLIKGFRPPENSAYPMTDAESIALERGDPGVLERLVLRFTQVNPQLVGLPLAAVESAVRGRANEVVFDAKRRREDFYAAAAKALVWLRTQPGRHSLVVISGGFAFDPGDDNFKNIVTLSLMANAPIHFLDARGLQGLGTFQGVEYGKLVDVGAGESLFSWLEASDGSASLALETGGLTVRNTNNFRGGLNRLLDTMKMYYVLAYEPPESRKPGFRKIKVEVKRKGLTVLARRGYYQGVTFAAASKPLPGAVTDTGALRTKESRTESGPARNEVSSEPMNELVSKLLKSASAYAVSEVTYFRNGGSLQVDIAGPSDQVISLWFAHGTDGPTNDRLFISAPESPASRYLVPREGAEQEAIIRFLMSFVGRKYNAQEQEHLWRNLNGVLPDPQSAEAMSQKEREIAYILNEVWLLRKGSQD